MSVQESSPADVADYASRYELGYTIGFDGSGHIFDAYRGFALPTQYFIDPNGVIASIVGAPSTRRVRSSRSRRSSLRARRGRRPRHP